jgi:monoamine oxidase
MARIPALFSLTRRRLLTGGLAATAFGALRPSRVLAQALPGGEVDLVVIGAGAAGLAAAREALDLGRSVLVIEAANCVGGRVHTDRSLLMAGGKPGFFDAGAQYIHWAERNPWRELARRHGFATGDDSGWGGPPAVFLQGRRLDDAERIRRRGGFGQVSVLIQAALRNGDASFADAVRDADAAVRQAAEGLTRFSLGEDPQRVSLADYDQLWSGDDDEIPGGYGDLVAATAAGLPIALGTPASVIDWSGGRVRVSTPRGDISAGAAIVTVSVGVLQAGVIRFTPALPPVIEDALHGLGMGALTKLAFSHDPAVAPDAPDVLDIIDERTTLSIEWRHRGQDGLGLVMLGGDGARAFSDLGQAGALAFLRERLAATLGGQAARAVIDARLAGWWSDALIRGSYSIARPGQLAARSALATPIGGRVFLAGEATAGGGAMTVGGATLEGRRAARLALRGKSG